MILLTLVFTSDGFGVAGAFCGDGFGVGQKNHNVPVFS